MHAMAAGAAHLRRSAPRRRRAAVMLLLVLARATATKSTCVEWLTVCTPPGCDAGNATTLAHAQRGVRGRVVTILGADATIGAITNANAPSRGNKLRIARRYLSSRKGPRCGHVVFADASDVIAGAGDAATVGAALDALARGDPAVLVASGEASCYVGAPCTARDAALLLRRSPAFPNSGLYGGRPEAVAAFLAFAVDALDAMAATRAPPAGFPLEDRSGRLAARCCDQCALGAYALARPESVVVDANETLFGSMKRFYVLGKRRAPSDDCRTFEPKRKRFAAGPGFHCSDGRNFRRFAWAGDPPALAFDGRTPPLVGWHANGAASRPLLRAAVASIP